MYLNKKLKETQLEMDEYCKMLSSFLNFKSTDSICYSV